MQEVATTQGYIFSPDNPIYHLARSESLTHCGLWLHGKPEERRRRNDLRLVSEKPTRQLTALCTSCQRKATGAPEPKRPSLELLSPRGLIDIP
jgi:hypothetical protein